jgi:hypothetical protein
MRVVINVQVRSKFSQIKRTLFHDRLGLLADFGLCLYLSPQQVASGEVREPEFLLQTHAIGALKIISYRLKKE